MLLIVAALDAASISPPAADTDRDSALLVAAGDDVMQSGRTQRDVVSLSAGGRRALFIALGVVLGIIFVVVVVLGFTCTLKHCQRLRHARQSSHRHHHRYQRHRRA